jgi:hypothetical protein
MRLRDTFCPKGEGITQPHRMENWTFSITVLAFYDIISYAHDRTNVVKAALRSSSAGPYLLPPAAEKPETFLLQYLIFPK